MRESECARFIEGEADSSLQPLAAGIYTGGAVAVKSGSTPVRGLVKSGQKWTRAEVRGFGQRLARARVATNWIQRQGQRALIPCVGSGQVETETETDKGTGVVT